MSVITQLKKVIGKKRNILILCHNNPDPDTIGSAYAFRFFLIKILNRRSVIGFGGNIGRAENKEFIRRLKIPLVHVQDLNFSRFSVICLLDCQPFTGNTSLPHNQPVNIVIDHHPLRKQTQKAPFYDVRPKYGSTATIITEYIKEANLKINKKIATALFYGLKTDTNNLLHSIKPDLEAFNFLFSQVAFKTLGGIENPPVPKSYFLEFEQSLNSAIRCQDVIISTISDLKTPETTAEMADFLLKMKNIRWTLCLGVFQNQLFLSVRTSRRSWFAGKIAIKILKGLGKGGGHEKSAGGVVIFDFQNTEKELQNIEITRIENLIITRFLKIIGTDKLDCKPLLQLRNNNSIMNLSRSETK